MADKDETIEYVVEGEEPIVTAEAETENDLTGGEVDENTVDADSIASDNTNADNDDNDDDETLHADATDDERSAIRERRKKERQERKQRMREREDTLRRELAAQNETITRLSQQLNEIQRRNVGGDMAKIVEAKRQVVSVYEQSKLDVQSATEKGDGRAVAEATERMIKARDNFNELDRIEKSFKAGSTRPQPLDPRLVEHAQQWTKANPWYDAQGKNTDSKIVMAIDNALADEGFDPTTKQYWDELDNRVKKYLPHRANRAIITSKPRNVVGSSSRDTPRSSSSDNGVFKLSKERVQAIKAVGAWDDINARNAMIKQYRDYDRANKGA